MLWTFAELWFNERTVKVTANGTQYFVFAQDIEEMLPQ